MHTLCLLAFIVFILPFHFSVSLPPTIISLHNYVVPSNLNAEHTRSENTAIKVHFRTNYGCSGSAASLLLSLRRTNVNIQLGQRRQTQIYVWCTCLLIEPDWTELRAKRFLRHHISETWAIIQTGLSLVSLWCCFFCDELSFHVGLSWRRTRLIAAGNVGCTSSSAWLPQAATSCGSYVYTATRFYLNSWHTSQVVQCPLTNCEATFYFCPMFSPTPQPPSYILTECFGAICLFSSSVSRPISTKQKRMFHNVARLSHWPSGAGTGPAKPKHGEEQIPAIPLVETKTTQTKKTPTMMVSRYMLTVVCLYDRWE